MPPPIHVVARQKVKEWVDLTLDKMPGPAEAFFPVNLLVDGRRTEPGLKPILGWLRREGPPISILTGKLGTGKTVASCVLQRTLSRPAETGALDLWVPFWRLKLRKSRGFPLRDLLEALGLRDDADEILHAPLRCLILDGVDELIYQSSARELQDWFGRLFQEIDLVRSRPKLLLVGKDVVFSSPGAFTDLLRERCARAERFPGPHRFEMEPWQESLFEDRLALLLERKLQERFRAVVAAEVQRRLRLLAPKVLSSPLFYRFAYDYLSKPAVFRGVRDQRELMQSWLEDILREQTGAAASLADRLDAAVGIATYLVLSGRGTAGATLEELQGEKGLQGIWAKLRSERDATPARGDSDLQPAVRRAVRELKHTTLMGCTNGRFAPFHEQVLIHLAAEGIGRILAAQPAPGSGGGGDPPARARLVKDLDGWQPATLDALLRYESLVELAQERAFAPLSTLEQALTYRLQAQPPGAALPLAPLRHLLRDGQPFDLRRAVLVVARDAALRTHPAKQAPLLENERQEIEATIARGLEVNDFKRLIEIDGHLLLPIPAGDYQVWDAAEDFRRLVEVCQTETIYLARDACTVEQYRRFLVDQLARGGEVELPRQPAAGWRLAGKAVTCDPAHADAPVTGISATEAEAYCSWLGSRVAPGTLGDARIGLPSPEVLRIALHGLEVWELPADPAPFGHLGLTAIWHWTARQEGAQRLLVGGSPTIGSVEILRRGWPTLDRLLPVNGYEPDTGFRVMLVPR
ncbi:MAG TPA: SUMF1/EgtB/PvdO family nonheme iron enzyme [Thermoanaerobaculia bacterium]|nr:SUMF1/EgtB/PvdO family nonheme iron enzyme [Thermoanaerobaculia bacterium]